MCSLHTESKCILVHYQLQNTKDKKNHLSWTSISLSNTDQIKASRNIAYI